MGEHSLKHYRMEIITNSRLITDFMGYSIVACDVPTWKVYHIDNAALYDQINRKTAEVLTIDGEWVMVGGLEYHTSWDWQIPVWSNVIQIIQGYSTEEMSSKLQELIDNPNAATPITDKLDKLRDNYSAATILNSPMNGFKVLVEAITFYNSIAIKTQDKEQFTDSLRGHQLPCEFIAPQNVGCITSLSNDSFTWEIVAYRDTDKSVNEGNVWLKYNNLEWKCNGSNISTSMMDKLKTDGRVEIYSVRIGDAVIFCLGDIIGQKGATGCSTLIAFKPDVAGGNRHLGGGAVKTGNGGYLAFGEIEHRP